jgi:hypothetical protein
MPSPTLITASFDTTRSNSTTTSDGEHIFNRHQERQINRAGRQRDIAVYSGHQLVDRFNPFFFTSQCAGSRTLDDRRIITVESIRSQQFADFHFYQFQQFRIIHQIYFVHENDDTGNTYLAGQQDMFFRLGHRTVSSSHHQDSAVHLGSAGDHIFYIVSVTRTVHVRIVTVSRRYST